MYHSLQPPKIEPLGRHIDEMNEAVSPGVLHVVLNLDPGGTERLVIEICSRLRGRVRTAVCCLDRRGDWADELEALGTPVFELRRQPGFRPELGLRIASIARRLRMNVLHCHHYSPFVYASIAKLRAPSLRVLYTEHGRLDNGPPSRKRRLVNQVLRAMPRQVYAVSDNLRQHMLREGFSDRQIAVIPNGIPLSNPPSGVDTEAIRRELGVEASAPVVGTVGRLDPVKGFDVLIRAFSLVRREVPAARLLIVGEGSDRARLIALSDELESGESVRFLGYRADVGRMLAAMDVYVNASLFEGISLTILEAMAAGKPVIATSVGGNPEIVRQGATGVLVPPNDARTLGRAIRDLCSDREGADALGRQGRMDVERRFTIDRMVDDYAGEYVKAGA